MENTENNKNYVICRLIKEGFIVAAPQITSEQATELKDYITEVYDNEYGGITIILEIILTN